MNENFEKWCLEHYPVLANSDTLDTKVKVIEHSLNKWKGLRKEALEKYDLEIQYDYDCTYVGNIKTNECNTLTKLLPINDTTCSLCVEYLNSQGGTWCMGCPINTCHEGDESPFTIFLYDNNPEPMIKLLEDALVKAKKEEEVKE